MNIEKIEEALLKLMERDKEYAFNNLESLLMKADIIYISHSDDIWCAKERLLRKGKIRVVSNLSGREKVMLN